MTDPFELEEGTSPTRVRFARFVSEPVQSEHETRLRDIVSTQPDLVVDLTGTMTLSTDWWRLLGRLGAFAHRTGGQVTVVGANSVGLDTADRVGARANLTIPESGTGT